MSLLDRFQSKVIAIKESKILDIMKTDKLMGSLQTFELNLRKRKKDKSIDSNIHKKKVWIWRKKMMMMLSF